MYNRFFKPYTNFQDLASAGHLARNQVRFFGWLPVPLRAALEVGDVPVYVYYIAYGITYGSMHPRDATFIPSDPDESMRNCLALSRENHLVGFQQADTYDLIPNGVIFYRSYYLRNDNSMKRPCGNKYNARPLPLP